MSELRRLPERTPEDQGSRVANAGAEIAVVVLVAFAGCACMVGLVLMMSGGGNCGPAILCTTTGQSLAYTAPWIGAAAGVVFGLTGTGLAPPKRFRYILTGYLVVGAGLITGALIANAPS